jgi:hypothetical protein
MAFTFSISEQARARAAIRESSGRRARTDGVGQFSCSASAHLARGCIILDGHLEHGAKFIIDDNCSASLREIVLSFVFFDLQARCAASSAASPSSNEWAGADLFSTCEELWTLDDGYVPGGAPGSPYCMRPRSVSMTCGAGTGAADAGSGCSPLR